jgi:hypothetical protein
MFQNGPGFRPDRGKPKKNEDKGRENGPARTAKRPPDPNRLWSLRLPFHNILWMPEFLVFIGKIGQKSVDKKAVISYNATCTAKAVLL